MNNIVTLSQLITRLARVTGTDTNTARRFVRAFFASVEDTLAAGENVEIKGIGTFRRNSEYGTIPGQPAVIFIPDESLAADINAPFSMFEAVELAPDTQFDEDKEDENKVENEEPAEEATTAPETEPQVEVETEPEAEPDIEVEIISAPEPEPEVERAHEPVKAPEPDDDYVKIPLGPADDDEEEGESEKYSPATSRPAPEHSRSKSNTWLWIALGILAGAAIGLIAAFLIPDDELVATEEAVPFEQPADTTVIAEVDVADLHSEAAEAPAPEPVVEATPEPVKPEPAPAPEAAPAKPEPRYDTVTRTRYLATMAREYYGRGIYWVFIYEANAEALKNPNRIKPGTKVLIPEKSSFAEATEEATMRKAEAKKAAIDKKYK